MTLNLLLRAHICPKSRHISCPNYRRHNPLESSIQRPNPWRCLSRKAGYPSALSEKRWIVGILRKHLRNRSVFPQSSNIANIQHTRHRALLGLNHHVAPCIHQITIVLLDIFSGSFCLSWPN